MLNQKILDEVTSKINDLMAQSPVKDVEKNIRAILAGIFTKLDLVTRDEFEVQREILKHAREKLTALEEKMAILEGVLRIRKRQKNKELMLNLILLYQSDNVRSTPINKHNFP